MEFQFWAQTDVGRQREHNEDNFLVDRKHRLFVVCDGMGGHAAGEVASSTAVHEVRKFILEFRALIEAYEQNDPGVSRKDVLLLLEKAVHHACAHIYQLAQKDPSRRGMGTTLVLLLVNGNRGFIAHVGDSRIYLLRKGQVQQLTEDHSLVNELIRRGKLKPGQPYDSPYKNAVTRAVGVYPSVDVDTFDLDILPGDIYLLCTDGLSGYLTLDRLKELVGTGQDLKKAAQSLIDFANSQGGKDNITAVLVRVEEEAPEEARKTEEVQLKMDLLKGIPLFRYLTFKELVKVMNITETISVDRGTDIVVEGEEGDRFYVVLEGELDVLKKGVRVARVGPGSHFGEMALVDRSPRSATVRATSPVKAMSIGRQAFYDLLRKDATLAVKLLWSFVQVLSVRLRLSTADLAESRSEHELVQEMGSFFGGDGEAEPHGTAGAGPDARGPAAATGAATQGTAAAVARAGGARPGPLAAPSAAVAPPPGPPRPSVAVEAPSPGSGPGERPSAAAGRRALEDLHAGDIEELRDDEIEDLARNEDIISTSTTFQALKLVASLRREGEGRASDRPHPQEGPGVVARGKGGGGTEGDGGGPRRTARRWEPPLVPEVAGDHRQTSSEEGSGGVPSRTAGAGEKAPPERTPLRRGVSTLTAFPVPKIVPSGGKGAPRPPVEAGQEPEAEEPTTDPEMRITPPDPPSGQ